MQIDQNTSKPRPKENQKKKMKLNTKATEFKFDSFEPQEGDFSKIQAQLNKLANYNFNDDTVKQFDSNTASNKKGKDKQKSMNEHQEKQDSQKQGGLESEETNDSKGDDDHESKTSSRVHKLSFDTQKNNQIDQNCFDNIRGAIDISENVLDNSFDKQFNENNSQNKEISNHLNTKENQNNSLQEDIKFDPSDSEHLLTQEYNFFYQPRGQIASQTDQFQNYKANTVTLKTVKSVEDFLDIYQRMKSPSQWNINHKVGLFKKGNEPLWEHYGDGGSLIMKFNKDKYVEQMDLLWETMLFSFIGGQFTENGQEVHDNIVGILMNIRQNENFLEIWLKNSKLKYETALEFKNFLNVDEKQPYYFKLHKKSIRTQSMTKEMEILKFNRVEQCYKSSIVPKEGHKERHGDSDQGQWRRTGKGSRYKKGW